jgi:hypothetical protein
MSRLSWAEAEKNYVRPSDREFFEACDWLRGALLG